MATDQSGIVAIYHDSGQKNKTTQIVVFSSRKNNDLETSVLFNISKLQTSKKSMGKIRRKIRGHVAPADTRTSPGRAKNHPKAWAGLFPIWPS